MFYSKRRCLPGLLLALTTVPVALAQQNTTFTTASAGNWTAFVSPGSIAAGFGIGLATSTTTAPSVPLGTTLGGATVNITDSAGVKTAAQLYMVSSGQINYLIPPNAALGKATVSVSANNATYSGTLEIANLSPSIFAANNSGSGVAAAQFLTVTPTGQATVSNTATTGVLDYVPSPVTLSPSANKVYLILYGTGFRNHSANPVKVSVNGTLVPVLYAAAQGSSPGLDQINVGPLPQSLAGSGKSSLNVVVTVDGIPANTTTIAIQ